MKIYKKWFALLVKLLKMRDYQFQREKTEKRPPEILNFIPHFRILVLGNSINLPLATLWGTSKFGNFVEETELQ
jgi:hypothetical protein